MEFSLAKTFCGHWVSILLIQSLLNFPIWKSQDLHRFLSPEPNECTLSTKAKKIYYFVYIKHITMYFINSIFLMSSLCKSSS